MVVLGRSDDRAVRERSGRSPGGPIGHIGACLAPDGSTGARVDLDLDRPHAGLVVGKRGSGKSYTLGVLAEELAAVDGVVPIVVDPMGGFETLGALDDVRVIDRPRVCASSLPPRAWCRLLELSPEGAAGGLVWRAAAEAVTLTEMCEHVRSADAEGSARRAAANHLRLADTWGVFDEGGLDLATAAAKLLVVNCSGLDAGPMNAVVHAIAAAAYDGRVRGRISRLPWLLVDEAHAFFDGVAGPALRTILTRGRSPGVGLVTVTQRPAALPQLAISQADLLVAHRLSGEADLRALARARPTYASTSLEERMPEAPGRAIVIDDATERVHLVAIRERTTPHGGESARASSVVSRSGKTRRSG